MISDYLSDRTAVGTSQWRPRQSNALATMSNPVAQAYSEMFGDTADFGGGDSGGSGVSSGVSSGVTGGTKGGTYAPSQPSFETGKAIKNIGRAIGMVAPGVFGSLAGAGIGLAGGLSDLEEANAALTARGFPEVSKVSAIVNSLSPFGALGESPESQYNSMMGFGLGAAIEEDDMVQGGMLGNWGPVGAMGFDDSYGDEFGGWGGYGGSYNTGPGADYESDPDGLGADHNDPGWDTDNMSDVGAEADDEDEGDDSIICTELMRQGRLSKRLWIIGTKEFQGYWEYGKRGYYLWSIPVVRHLKAHPDSRFSRFIERLFNIRAEYVAARNGYRYRKTLLGAVVTKVMYGLCWSLAVCSALVQGFSHRRPRPEIVFGRRLVNHGRSAAGVKFVQGDKKPLGGRRGLGDRRHSHLREAGVRSCQLTVHERVGLHQFRDKFWKNFDHLFVRWDANVRHFTRLSLLAQTVGVVKTLKVGGAQHHAADATGDQLCVCVETAGVSQITGRLDWLEHISRLLNLRGLSARGEHQGHNGQYDLSHTAAYTPSYEARNG